MVALCILLLLSFYAVSKDYKESLDYVVIIMGFGFPFYIILFFGRFTYSNENRISLLERYYKIEEDQIVGYLEDGTESRIKLNHVVKIYKTKDFVLVYLSQVTFLYLPKDAFKSEGDYIEAIRHIESKIEK